MPHLLRSAATYVALALGLAGVAVILFVWRLPPFASALESTDNAYVKGQVTLLSSQLTGYVAEVAVQDYQAVKAGDVLARIDDRALRQKVEQAKATLAAQQAALANSGLQRASGEARVRVAEAALDSARSALATAEAAWKRIEPLRQRGIVNQSDADKARTAFEQAGAASRQAQAALDAARQDLAVIAGSRASLEAGVKGAEAAVHLAEIDLRNATVRAPQDGRLGEVGVRAGQYVAPGTQLMALVPERLWVVANFKETQLPGMKVGQPVTMKVDALDHAAITGRVERFAPATGSEFSILKPDNATGNFTKVAQRIPVRIAIDAGQALAGRLAPGMSVEVSIDTSAGGGGAVAEDAAAVSGAR
jgi:multidrug resistance efflux pump